MDFSEIKLAIYSNQYLKSNFIGIFNRNQLFQSTIMANRHSNSFYFIFIENKNLPYGHYVCVFKFNEVMYFIDSFGKSPDYYEIKPGKNMEYNEVQIQSSSSCLCGAYLLLILELSIKSNKNPNYIINKIFSSTKLKNNDLIAFNYISKYLSNSKKKLMKCIF